MEIWEILRFVLALGFVLGLVGLCAWLARRVGLTHGFGGAAAANRLGVIEIKAVDSKRKLVLVRRDKVEHLLLLNGERDLLIEQGITGTEADCKPAGPATPPRLHFISGNDKP